MAKHDDELKVFAALKWPKRFNAIGVDSPVAALDQVGQSMFLVTSLGFVYFDLEEDGPHVLRHLEAACDLLRDALP